MEYQNNPFACLFDENGESIDHVFTKKEYTYQEDNASEEIFIDDKDYNQLMKMCYELRYDCWVDGADINTIGIRSDNYEQIIMTSVRSSKYEIRADVELNDEECLKYINVFLKYNR